MQLDDMSTTNKVAVQHLDKPIGQIRRKPPASSLFDTPLLSQEDRAVIGRAKRGGGGEKRSGRIAELTDLTFFSRIVTVWTEDFPRVAQQKKRVREEGRLTKIPLPDGEVQRCYQKTRRDGDGNKKKRNANVGVSRPFSRTDYLAHSEGPYRNLAWKAAKTWLVKKQKETYLSGRGRDTSGRVKKKSVLLQKVTTPLSQSQTTKKKKEKSKPETQDSRQPCICSPDTPTPSRRIMQAHQHLKSPVWHIPKHRVLYRRNKVVATHTHTHTNKRMSKRAPK